VPRENSGKPRCKPAASQCPAKGDTHCRIVFTALGSHAWAVEAMETSEQTRTKQRTLSSASHPKLFFMERPQPEFHDLMLRVGIVQYTGPGNSQGDATSFTLVRVLF
jgi:hypothetical protein